VSKMVQTAFNSKRKQSTLGFYAADKPHLYDFETLAAEGVTTLRTFGKEAGPVGVSEDNNSDNPCGDEDGEELDASTAGGAADPHLDEMLDSIPEGGDVFDIDIEKNQLDVGGGVMQHIVSITRLVFGAGFATSADKLRRVRGYKR